MIHGLIDRVAILDVVGIGDRVRFAHVSYHSQKGFVSQLIGGVELFGREVVGFAILHELLDQSLVEPIVISGHVHNKGLVTDNTQLLQQCKQDTRRDGSLEIICFHLLMERHKKEKKKFFLYTYQRN
jgi:hypothetical protein